MKSGDSRGASGVFYPFQDHRPKETKSGRSALVGVRIVSEDPEWGQPVEDPKKRGIVQGFYHWASIGDVGTYAGTNAATNLPGVFSEVRPVVTVAPTATPSSANKPGKAPVAPLLPPGNGPGFYSPTFGGFVGSAPPSDFDPTWGTAIYIIGGSGEPKGSIAAKSAKSTGTGALGSVPTPPPTPPALIYIRIDNPNPFAPIPFPAPPPAPDGYVFTGNVFAHEIGGPPAPGGTGHLMGTDYWQYEYAYKGTGGVDSGSGNEHQGTGDAEHPGSAGSGPGFAVRPTINETYDPDFSMALLEYKLEDRQPYMPRFPIGHFGIVVATMDFHKQVEQFGSIDPRLPAVNFAGGGACGALVCDLYPDSRYDQTRMAHLQSALRVLKKPTVKVGANARYGGLSGTGNALALQFGVSGQGDSPGGFVFDATQAVAAKWSSRDGGCMNCGSGSEKHVIGSDADGNAIHGMHLDTLSLFTNGAQDGPFVFEPKAPVLADDGFYIQRVHIGFKADEPYEWPRPSRDKSMKGCWVPWVRVPLTVVTPKDPPHTPGGPTTPKDPPPPDLPGPTTPHGGPEGGGPVTPGTDRKNSTVATIARNSSFVMTEHRQNLVTLGEIAGPGILARPQRYESGERDLRYAQGWGDAEAVAKQEAKAPITARISAWGAQGGKKGGTYLPNPGTATQVGGTPWVYTQSPGSSRHIGGTAPGGWLVTPPEVDISDIDDTFAPTGLTVSPTYLATAPGAYFGAGTPELATGGLMNGWSWGSSGTELKFRSHSNVGVATDFLTFRIASNDVVLNDGLAVVLGTSSGTRWGTAAGQKQGWWGASPAAQPSSTGETSGFTAGAGTTVTDESTFTGGSGTKAYRISDIVKNLKAAGLLASS